MPAKNDDMLVASESFVTSEGQSYIKNVTRVRASDPAARKFKSLFKPLDVSYPAVEAAVAAPGEPRGAAKAESMPEAKEEPEAKADKPSGLTTSSLKKD